MWQSYCWIKSLMWYSHGINCHSWAIIGVVTIFFEDLILWSQDIMRTKIYDCAFERPFIIGLMMAQKYC